MEFVIASSLLLDIAGYHILISMLPYCACKISISPEFSSPELFLYLGASLEYLSCGNTLYDGNYSGHIVCRNRLHEKVHMIDGQEIAGNLGNPQAADVVIMGAFSSFFPELKETRWIDAIESLLAPKLHDLNVKAFYEGRKILAR